MQSLLDWVSHNSEYAIFAVFFVSTLESLALVGIMVPGMLFMLGVGTLIGIGTLPFWPMFIAATLGAIAGDGLSFWLGRHFNENLRHLWPLPKFPGLIHKGEEFFHRHGAMSVLFGRFIGPLRAIIPAIAGMLQMEPGRFLIFNVISALAWAPTVLLPGAVLGASLAQVSAVAMRFGVLVFAVGLAFWCIGWVINHAIRHFVLERFPALAYAQLWRISAHMMVYTVIVVSAMFYRVQAPQFPAQAQLQQISSEFLRGAEGVSSAWQTLADQGLQLVWVGSESELRQGLQQSGWQQAEQWNLATVLAWMADSSDLLQLVFSDPRLDMYKYPLEKQAWIKAENQQQVWIVEFWSVPEQRSRASEKTVIFAAIKRFSVFNVFMGYRYFNRDDLSEQDKQGFYLRTAQFNALLLNKLHYVYRDQSGRYTFLRQ